MYSFNKHRQLPMPQFSLALDMIRGNEPRLLPHQASIDTNQHCSLVSRVQGAAVVRV